MSLDSWMGSLVLAIKLPSELERGKPKDQHVGIGYFVIGTVQQDIVSMTKSSMKGGIHEIVSNSVRVSD